MSESIENNESIEQADGVARAQRGRRIVLLVLGVAVAAVVVFGVIQLAGGGLQGEQDPTTSPTAESPSEPTPTADPTDPTEPTDADGATEEHPGLPDSESLKDKSGQELVDAIGENVDVVARNNDMTPEALKELLLNDSTVRIGPGGAIYYVESAH